MNKRTLESLRKYEVKRLTRELTDFQYTRQFGECFFKAYYSNKVVPLPQQAILLEKFIETLPNTCKLFLKIQKDQNQKCHHFGHQGLLGGEVTFHNKDMNYKTSCVSTFSTNGILDRKRLSAVTEKDPYSLTSHALCRYLERGGSMESFKENAMLMADAAHMSTKAFYKSQLIPSIGMPFEKGILVGNTLEVSAPGEQNPVQLVQAKWRSFKLYDYTKAILEHNLEELNMFLAGPEFVARTYISEDMLRRDQKCQLQRLTDLFLNYRELHKEFRHRRIHGLKSNLLSWKHEDLTADLNAFNDALVSIWSDPEFQACFKNSFDGSLRVVPVRDENAFTPGADPIDLPAEIKSLNQSTPVLSM